MQNRFDYFVVFAEMRTGSNFLEANLNAFANLTCYGEAFNPHFIGYPNTPDILGITLPMREADPRRVIQTIKTGTKGLGGFRFFHDHDARALGMCLADPRCAKIILTRNPLDSYVSWKIAQKTGQWKLTDIKRRKEARITFDSEEFETHLDEIQQFQVLLKNSLQISGQTAFYLAYEDLQDVEVMNGLAKFLGETDQLGSLDQSLKRQNPAPLADKVTNYDGMVSALARIDRFNLTRTPNFEPRRGPAVAGYVAAAKAPLLFMPVRSAPDRVVQGWLAALDGVAEDGLQAGFNQKTLRQWKRQHTGHRSFTVLRHPVARAHTAFCRHILVTGHGSYSDIRATLRTLHNVDVPAEMPDASYDLPAHRAAFLAFLEFVKANLAGQTGLRIDPAWASQASLVQGMAQFALPDEIIREEDAGERLPALAARVGCREAPQLPQDEADQPFSLADIYDDTVETAVSDVYRRDYLMFGFGPWA